MLIVVETKPDEGIAKESISHEANETTMIVHG